MEIKQLTALGITEETAAKVLEMHTAELTSAEEKVSAAEKKLTASEATVSEITAKLKAFDGVDVEKLKSDVTAWEKKYSEDMAAAKIDSALDLALTKAGARDVALTKHLIDRNIIKADGDSLIGLSEQLEKIKTDKAWLFCEDKKPAEQLPDISTGMSHGAPSSESVPLTLSGALKEHFNN